MGLSEKSFEEGVYVGGKRAEGRVVSHKPVDVNHEELPLSAFAMVVAVLG